MRRATLMRAAEAVGYVDEERGEIAPRTEAEIARAALVESFGPRTAGWLLAKHRGQLHAHGAVDFVVPAKPNKVTAEKLRWFFVAMDYLRRRAGWAVDITTRRERRTFRVRWLGWKTWLPSSRLS